MVSPNRRAPRIAAAPEPFPGGMAPTVRYRPGGTLNAERIVRIVAGSFVLLSLALGVEGSPLFVARGFLWFTAFVGANLLQSGFTRFCPLELILARFGVACACGAAPVPKA